MELIYLNLFTPYIFNVTATVYYRGSAVSWDYGRTMAVFSYSDVQSSVYEHSATANTTSSGWKKPGKKSTCTAVCGYKESNSLLELPLRLERYDG